nr:hypothetical protein [Pyrinomonadaceae bacterium]
MNAKRKSFFLTVLLTLSLSSAVAQTAPETTSANKANGNDEEARKQLERKAYALLDEVIGGTGSLKLPENQALLQTRAAALLWSQDEKRARALFSDAINN